jgi:hypothetical protein
MLIQCSTCPRPAAAVAELADGDRPACTACLAGWTCNTRPIPHLGQLMWGVVIFTRACPGSTRGATARALGHLADRKVIYAAATRCERAGLVVNRGTSTRGALYLSTFGEHVRAWSVPAR